MDTKSRLIKEDAMTQQQYTIPNISCGHCVATITNELKELDGVNQVDGDPTTKTITVLMQIPATDEQIRSKLVEIGYPAQS
jgi:copper chaperone